MKNFNFWQKWLFIIGIVITIFGILLAFLGSTRLFFLFDRYINLVFWTIGAVPENARQYQYWIYGVLGAVMAGWGVFLVYLAKYPFTKKEKWSWNCITLGTLTWFIIDTSFSCIYKVYYNAIGNVLLFVLIALPLLFTKKHFDPEL